MKYNSSMEETLHEKATTENIIPAALEKSSIKETTTKITTTATKPLGMA